MRILNKKMRDVNCKALKKELIELYNTHESHYLVKKWLLAKFNQIYKDKMAMVLISPCKISLENEMSDRALSSPFVHFSFKIDFHGYEVLIAACD